MQNICFYNVSFIKSSSILNNFSIKLINISIIRNLIVTAIEYIHPLRLFDWTWWPSFAVSYLHFSNLTGQVDSSLRVSPFRCQHFAYDVTLLLTSFMSLQYRIFGLWHNTNIIGLLLFYTISTILGRIPRHFSTFFPYEGHYLRWKWKFFWSTSSCSSFVAFLVNQLEY